MINWLMRAEDSLQDLLETDRQLAELRVKWERDRRKAENIYDAVFDRTRLDTAGKPLTVESRKVKSRLHPEYQSQVAAEMTSLLEFEALKQRRDTNRMVIEFWKSYQRAQREGEI